MLKCCKCELEGKGKFNLGINHLLVHYNEDKCIDEWISKS